MARVKLTAGRIRSFACPPDKTQTFLWDTEVPGLGVRATPTGAKSYIFQGKIKSKSLRITIGDIRTWPIESSPVRNGGEPIPGAREEARRLQTLIDQGVDPRQAKVDQFAAAEAKAQAKRDEDLRLSIKVGEVWTQYIAERSKKWGTRHLEAHERMADPGGKPKSRGRRQGESDKTVAGPLASLMPVPLSQLDADQVKEWLKDEAVHRPTYARLAFNCLRAFLNWCSDRPEYRRMVHPGACAARIAKEFLPKSKPKADCLQREQLATWFKAVRAHHNPVISAYLQILLLTGARREEIAGIRWENVDFRWNSLTIRDKVEGERSIPLTPYVSTLLRELKARNETPPPKPRKLRQDTDGTPEEWKPSPWVFSSPTAKSGRLQEPRIAHGKALAMAGLPALSLHGLRRSFGTLAEWTECPAGVVAQIMGHKPTATAEKHYRVRPLDLLRMWHTKIEAWTLEQAGIVFDAEQKLNLRIAGESH